MRVERKSPVDHIITRRARYARQFYLYYYGLHIQGPIYHCLYTTYILVTMGLYKDLYCFHASILANGTFQTDNYNISPS